jgi:hypothetical protein
VKNILIIIVGIVLGAVLYYFVTNFFGCNQSIRGANRVPDPDVVYRYLTELEEDTTKAWWNFRWNKPTPEIIYETKVDSQFYEVIKYHPVILKGRKEGDRFKVFALSHDSLLQEFVFKDVGRDFTFASKPHGVSIKSKRIYFNSPYIEINQTQPLFIGTKLKDGGLGISTGMDVSYMDKVTLGVELNYQSKLEDPVSAKVKLRYYPFR